MRVDALDPDAVARRRARWSTCVGADERLDRLQVGALAGVADGVGVGDVLAGDLERLPLRDERGERDGRGRRSCSRAPHRAWSSRCALPARHGGGSARVVGLHALLQAQQRLLRGAVGGREEVAVALGQGVDLVGEGDEGLRGAR